MNPSQTDVGASTFAYSEKDIQEILEGIEDSITQFEHKAERTLAQYVKARFILRGLRVNLQPNLCADDPTLTKRWEEICNKCSLDLMVLTIERLQDKAKIVKGKIADLKQQVIATKGAEATENILAEHADLLHKHREKLVERKQRKFERDAKDFQENRIYTWREEQRRQRGQQSGRGFRRQTGLPDPHQDRYRPAPRQDTRDADRGRGRDYMQYNRDLSTDSSRSSTSIPSTSSASNSSGNQAFLGGTYEHPQRKNPRAPIQREQYPSRKRR
ncbi:hypothetical protein XELAEV_18033164mg [Xenopus laevis]|uniref:Uncharacterized protein n=1 Tax=Xenopus laevis TaxID=8355 RepID=A0A974HDR3_XENLA|nr:hypothetical protein XELAEV_18033164mg [Xenopus laevis]